MLESMYLIILGRNLKMIFRIIRFNSINVLLVMIMLFAGLASPVNAKKGLPSVGERVPNILVNQIGSKKLFNLRKQKINKYAIISFSATYCKPCRKEIEEFTELQRKYKNALKVFMVFIDEQAKDIEKYIDKNNVTLKVLHDRYKFASETYVIKKLPSTFLIDKKGKLLYRSIGFRKTTMKELMKHLKI